jgi:hypothetical protein
VIKNLSACKPDSVSRPKPGWLSFIWQWHYYHHLAAYPFCDCKNANSKRAACSGIPAQNIHGITAHKVYPSCQLPGRNVGSYPTFSLLPAAQRADSSASRFRKLFSVALSVHSTFVDVPAVNRCVALCCPDFPPTA